ncbi:insecticidal delta-endotoxin Cry8Ea1 family protein [Bacillus toyonensis]|uniref:insecticidal delta-endotoxin Cry8Ea1 family protein n=1 Tax=Bacillus toyonensis TaxID=155322 RepID=UPI0015D500D5|nr:insecticidal delta-endotoxin Cry8Ea1 family protein [Bacillus toyonensis]
MPNIDQVIQSLPKVTSAADYKTSLTLFEKAVPAVIKDVNQGTINNTIKSFAVYGTSLIPWGGVLISPLISLLWPEFGGNKTLKEMRQEISDEIDEKIKTSLEEFDKARIKTDAKTLFEELQKFEQLINETVGIKYESIIDINYSDILSPGDYNAGTPDATARDKASSIDLQFTSLIEECSKELDRNNLLNDMDVWELPIYVILATAHLQFLYFMHENGKESKIQYDNHTWESYYYYPLIKKNREYRDYIEGTYKKGLKQFESQLNDINTNGFNEFQCLEFLKNQISYYSTAQPHISVNQNLVNQWKNKFKKYENLIKERNKYLEITINNTAFNLALPGRWVTEEDGYYYYLDNDDCRKYRWLNDRDHYYYLNPEKYGQMQTGWYVDVDQQWYYFNPYPQNYNHSSHLAVGEMFHSGHYIIDNHGYHFNNSGACENPYTAQLESSKTIIPGNYRIIHHRNNNLVLGSNYNKTYHIPDNVVAFFTRNNQDISQEWEVVFDSGKTAYQIINKRDSHLVLAWNKNENHYDQTVIVAPNEHKDEHYWILTGTLDQFSMINYSEQNKKMGLTDLSGYSEVYVGVVPGNITSAFKLEKY